MADPREARFLASQAERLAGNNNKKQLQSSNSNNCKINDSSPELVNEDNNAADTVDNTSTKAQSNQFFTNFRKICSQYQGQIDTLLLVPSSTSDLTNDSTATTTSTNYTEAKAYYATSTKRNEGQLQLNSILNNVRTLQRHSLSSSSSINTHTESTSVANTNDNDELLQSILQTPMTDITQTDIRLISSELDKIIKYIDVAREIICPKEKFIFKRYRKAMAEQKMLEGESGIMHSTSEAAANENNNKEKEEDEKQQQDNLRTKYGGVLEDMSNCTVEISASGTVLLNETTQDDLQFYSAPRSVHTLHPPSHTVVEDQANDESSSYLLQNLSNATILIHGSRPSLHLQHIYNCKVYISQPTLGPVHVTDCISSSVHCSCYQLRIHESKDVRFKCWVRSGPIIEDCSGMVFEGDYYLDNDGTDGSCGVGSNLYWDVKDFNWLRTLRKSPNFVVVSDTKESAEAVVSKQKSEPVVSSVEAASAEEDSEDEL